MCAASWEKCCSSPLMLLALSADCSVSSGGEVRSPSWACTSMASTGVWLSINGPCSGAGEGSSSGSGSVRGLRRSRRDQRPLLPCSSLCCRVCCCSCCSSSSSDGSLRGSSASSPSWRSNARSARDTSRGGSQSCSCSISCWTALLVLLEACWRFWSAVSTARSRSGSSSPSRCAGASERRARRSSFRRLSSSGSIPEAAILTRTRPRLSSSVCSSDSK